MNKNIEYIIISILVILITIQNTHAGDIWSEGTTYRISPTDNMVTVKNYTIKAIDFPAPVLGIRTISGGIEPNRPVTPFVMFELYKDIENNANPIGIFSLGIGDEFITSDKEIRIVLENIPGDMSQDWVYEYYNPWVEIRIQKRGLPSIGVDVVFEKDDNIIDYDPISGNIIDDDDTMDENAIDPGEKFRMVIKVTNPGEDIINNINIYVEDPSKMVISHKLEYNIHSLDKSEEEIANVSINIPKIMEEREYEIYVNVTGYDKKNIEYSINTSKKIKVRDPLKFTLESLRLNKTVARDTLYLNKGYETVIYDIMNLGNIYMQDVRITDSWPNETVYTIDKNITEFYINKSSIRSRESWSFSYFLMPTEPGIYVLPGFKLTFSLLGQYYEMKSNEVGFRVFGPKVILTKTAKKNEEDNDIIQVNVVANNIGNGLTKVVIEDKLPEKAVLLSGNLNLTTSLDPGKEKTMSYAIRIDSINEDEKGKRINISKWPPAKARYYMDDYVFITFSNETIIPYEKLIWTVRTKEEEEKKKEYEEREKEKKGEEKGEEKDIDMEMISTTVILPEMTETQKRVVATIPAKAVKTPEKGITGFRLYEIWIVIVLILLGRKLNKK